MLRNKTTYTRSDIRAWEHSLQTLPGEIDTLKVTIQSLALQLSTQTDALNQLTESKIAPTKLLIDKLNAKIQLPSLLCQIDILVEEASEFEHEAGKLNRSIEQKQQAAAPLRLEIERINKLIKIKNTQITVENSGLIINQLIDSRNQVGARLTDARLRLSLTQSTIANIEMELANHERVSQNIIHSSIYHHAVAFPHSPGMVSSQVTHGHSTSSANTSHHPVISTQVNTGHAIRANQPSFHQPVVSNHVTAGHSLPHPSGQALESCKYRLRIENIASSRIRYEVSQLENQVDDYNRRIRIKENERNSLQLELNSYSANEIYIALNKDRNQLNIELHAVENNLAPLEKQINNLQTKQRSLQNHAFTNRGEANQLKERCDSYTALIKDFEMSNDPEILQHQCAEHKKILSELKSEAAQINTKISSLKFNKIEVEIKLQQLERQLITKNSNEFLIYFRDKPQDILSLLKSHIIMGISSFESNHPYQQHITIKKLILELPQKISYLSEVQLTSEWVERDEHIIDRYYLLYGMMQQLLVETNAHSSFCEEIRKALQWHQIDVNEAKNEFTQFMVNRLDKLYSLSITDVLNCEQTAYNDAYNSFNDLLERLNTSLHPKLKETKTLGLSLLINIASKAKEATPELPFDFKYYTKLINFSAQLLTNPADNNLRHAYNKLINHHPSETPSIGFKITGIAMMLLGTVIAASAAVVAMLGFPIGAPLYYSMPAAGFGVATIIGGIGLFKYGCKKGLPGTLQGLATETEARRIELRSGFKEAGELTGPGSYQPSAPPLNM